MQAGFHGRDRGRRRVLDPFSPRSIPGLCAWWQASAITWLSHGDPVSAWPDLSGHGRDATQATSASQPTYKSSGSPFPFVSFDGVDDALTGNSGLAAGSAITLVVVASSVDTTAYSSTLSLGIATTYQELGIMLDSTGDYLAVSNFAGPTSTAGDRYTTAVAAGWQVVSLVYAPLATPVLRQNGNGALGYTTSVGDWSGTNLNNGANNYPFALGAAAGGTLTPHAVHLAEALIYSRALSDGERGRLEKTLGARYGLTIT
jgi:hypothetical protein